MLSALKSLSNVKKLLVFIASQVISAVNEGLVPEAYVNYVRLALFFLTSILIYAAANKPTVASAVSAATSAAETVEEGAVPSLDELSASLDSLLKDDPAGKHADAAAA